MGDAKIVGNIVENWLLNEITSQQSDLPPGVSLQTPTRSNLGTLAYQQR